MTARESAQSDPRLVSGRAGAVDSRFLLRQIAACGWLFVLCAAAYPLFAWYGFSRAGGVGLSAALAAAGVCWSGGAIALVASTWHRGSPQAVSGVLVGMLFRFGLPLAAIVLLKERGGALVEAGVVGMLMGYYLITLTAETLLSLRILCVSGRPAPADNAGSL